MAKFESKYCPECDEAFDYPEPLGRRDFLRTTAASAAARPPLLCRLGLADVVVPNEPCAAQQEEKPDEPLAQARSARRLQASLRC